MNLRKLFILLASAALLTVAGCAQQGSSTASTVETTGAQAAAEKAALEAQQRKTAMLEKELRERDRDLANLRSELQKGKADMGAKTSGSGDLFPPNPRPGECYARVIVPAQYKTTTRTVVKREAGERIEVIPAAYEPSTERVLVKPASTRLVEVPAEYRTETQRVLDKPAYTEWKRGTGSGKGAGAGAGASSGGAAALVQRFGDQKVVSTRVDDTGEVMCLVEVPATYKTLTKQVLVRPATTKTIEIPAEYKTIKTMKLARPASERRIAIPEQTDTLTTTEKVAGEYIEFRPVLCEVNMTPQNVSALQAALNKRGGKNCNVDGIMGPCTLTAARSYADSKGLPAGNNYITLDVVRSLGLKF